MSSDNGALGRTYFIGGPPRVGKSILAYTLAKEIGGHVVSTDSIRDAAKKASVDRESDLFILSRVEKVSEREWVETHLKNPERVIEYQNRESNAYWASVVAFASSFCEDDALHIIEGVALLPSLVAGMKHRPAHVAYVGNTSAEHVDSMLRHMRSFPERDWMGAMKYSEEKVRAMASFVRAMSEFFKKEAAIYSFPYFEINDTDFEGSMATTIASIRASL